MRIWRSLFTILSLNSRFCLRASTFNEGERSAHSSNSKICESRKQSKHHVFRISRPLLRLPVLYTSRDHFLRQSLRVFSQTQLTQDLVTEPICRYRARVTHNVKHCTRILVNCSCLCRYEITRVHVIVLHFTTSCRTRAQLMWWPPRNSFNLIFKVRNQSRVL